MSNPGIWLGLLKWSLGQGDGTMPSQTQEMSAEDKAFLENVMKECVLDEPQRMQDIMARFVELLNNNQTNDFTDEIIDKLHELKDIVGQIDMAQTFVKFGGIECLLRLMELVDLDTDARSAAAATVGTVCQNNIVSQQTVFELGALQRLVSIFLSTSTSNSLRAKVIYSISGLIRGHAAAEDAFITQFADRVFPIVASNEVHDNPSLSIRGLYMATALLACDNSSAERTSRIVPTFMETSVLQQCLHSEHVDVREAILSFVNAVINSVGGTILIQPHRMALDSAISQRQAQLASASATATPLPPVPDSKNPSAASATSANTAAAAEEQPTDINVEQLEHELQLLGDIIAHLDGRRRSISSGSPRTAQVSSPQLLLL